MHTISWVLAISVGLAIATAPAARGQSEGGMHLDQRNMHLHAAGPMQDFAQIGDSNGGDILGTISMIDGNQTANFDGNGQFVSGTGRFEYKAKVPDGLYMDLKFKMGGKTAHGGVFITDMIVEFRSQTHSGIQRVVIRKLKLANNKFEYSLLGKGDDIVSGASVVKNKSIAEGRLRLQLANLKGRGENQWFAVHLDRPLNGTLQ